MATKQIALINALRISKVKRRTAERKNEYTPFEASILVEKLRSLSKSWKKSSYIQKHQINEIICLNIIVNSKKRLHVNLKPEIAGMFIHSGGLLWLNFEQLDILLNRDYNSLSKIKNALDPILELKALYSV